MQGHLPLGTSWRELAVRCVYRARLGTSGRGAGFALRNLRDANANVFT